MGLVECDLLKVERIAADSALSKRADKEHKGRKVGSCCSFRPVKV